MPKTPIYETSNLKVYAPFEKAFQFGGEFAASNADQYNQAMDDASFDFTPGYLRPSHSVVKEYAGAMEDDVDDRGPGFEQMT